MAAVTGVVPLRAREPAIASTGMIRKNLPINIATPIVVSYDQVDAVRPAKADPLLFAPDV
ncbi:Uncharacterised protein [Mycobacterium tuberculosis]|nr:Uncharacterised protein [Mycobacterium tuberculosis]CPB39179.1 Uncharacterised protein [Mycobacterium tuberculosis]CPB42938.1 Uncharacterised protein [Mycobacterium tuberculosis]